jgi:hypothetical protein
MRKHGWLIPLLLMTSLSGMTVGETASVAIISHSKQESEKLNRNRRIAGHHVLMAWTKCVVAGFVKLALAVPSAWLAAAKDGPYPSSHRPYSS